MENKQLKPIATGSDSSIFHYQSQLLGSKSNIGFASLGNRSSINTSIETIQLLRSDIAFALI